MVFDFTHQFSCLNTVTSEIAAKGYIDLNPPATCIILSKFDKNSNPYLSIVPQFLYKVKYFGRIRWLLDDN